MSELLPCPFCGNETPEFERVGSPRQSCIVSCGSCGARHESSDEGSRNGSSWNQRAAVQAAQPEAVGEPVAWHVNHCGSCQIYTSLDSLDLTDCIVKPLYAAAPTEAKPAQQDAVDAERYRWLRDRSAWTLISANGITRLAARLPITIEGDQDDAHELDAAIDAAISAKKGTL